MFSLQFKTDNAAFQDGEHVAEIARILRDIAGRVETGNNDELVFDANGNSVGQWCFDEPETADDASEA